jgi:hypothetical protein
MHASEIGDSNGDVTYDLCRVYQPYIVHEFVLLLENRKRRYDGWPIHSSSHDIQANRVYICLIIVDHVTVFSIGLLGV